MKIILYVKGKVDYANKLENRIHSVIPGLKINVFNAIDRLSQLLRQPLQNIFIAILLPASRAELAELIGMAVLFDNVRVILILPDRSKRTQALGLTLRTSFISYVDNNVEDVLSVLQHLIKKNGA
ncbi:MAG: hypothetical protein QM498_00115 [Desulfobacterium sp.]